jgi:penicillin-binding protein 1C
MAERRMGSAAVKNRAALLLMLGAAWVAPGWALPDFAAVKAGHQPSDVTLLDRHGEPLQTVRIDMSVRRGPWVALADLSPALREAIVLGEDRRFWEHAGVDWPALAAAAWSNAWNTRSRGASTLTMQLAGLLDDQAARPAGGRGVGGKVAQIRLAGELERRWRKTEILEAYLNHVPLRGEMVGVPAAAQMMFGKHPSGLDTAEAAVIAVLVRAPNAEARVVVQRACQLLILQKRDCQGLDSVVARAFERRHGPWPGPALAPHLARQFVGRPAPGGIWRSTLDASVQRGAAAALRQQLAELRGHNVHEGAVVVLDNRSGEVLAWVGGAASASAASEVDTVLARRQPGSTLKPFVYALAFEQGLIDADSLLLDAPWQLDTGPGLYQPRNYDTGYRGWVSARVALASSLNVPAARLAHSIGVDELFQRLNGAGLRLRESAGYHGLALALGSADVNLIDLSNAYRMLANDGMASEPNWMMTSGPTRLAVSARAQQRRVFGRSASRSVAQVLADGSARALSFGFDSPLVTRVQAAVKTGTSQDHRDNWCVGFTDRYTVGVWLGNPDGSPMHTVSGVMGAAPVWRQVIEQLHAGSPSRSAQDERGAGMARLADVGAAPGGAVDGARAQPVPLGIVSPAPGSVWVIDPAVPAAAQRILLSGPAGGWHLGRQPIGHGARVWWSPRVGRHSLELRGPNGRLLDRVSFEVRQAARPAPVPKREAISRRSG